MKKLENKHMASLYFFLFFLFVCLFAWNRYTWNAILTFVCLILAVSYKTWDLINDARIEIHEQGIRNQKTPVKKSKTN